MTHEQRLCVQLNDKLVEIEKIFHGPVKLTLLAIVPGVEDGGVLMTNTPTLEIMKAIYRLSDAPPVIKEGDEIPV